MSTSEENLRKLADKMGIGAVQEGLSLQLLDYPDNLEAAQAYMLGALHRHIEDDFPTETEIAEYYELLGLSPEESKK